MMKISQIIHWLLRMFVYACMGTSAMLLVYDFEDDCWFCGHANKARQSEAKQYINFMNKAQQANYVEYESFGNSMDNLGLGIKTDTTNYSYRILSPMNPVQNVEELKPSPLDESRTIAFATPKKPNLKSYMGIVWTLPSTRDTTTTSAICLRQKEQILYPSILPEISDNEVSCPPGFEILE